MTAATFTPFSYTHGPAGFVPTAALRSFQNKDKAVQDAMAAKDATDIHDECARTMRMNDAMTRIQAANRTIKRNGWHFHITDPRPAAAALAAYRAGSITASVASKPATAVTL